MNDREGLLPERLKLGFGLLCLTVALGAGFGIPLYALMTGELEISRRSRRTDADCHQLTGGSMPA